MESVDGSSISNVQLPAHHHQQRRYAVLRAPRQPQPRSLAGGQHRRRLLRRRPLHQHELQLGLDRHRKHRRHADVRHLQHLLLEPSTSATTRAGATAQPHAVPPPTTSPSIRDRCPARPARSTTSIPTPNSSPAPTATKNTMYHGPGYAHFVRARRRRDLHRLQDVIHRHRLCVPPSPKRLHRSQRRLRTLAPSGGSGVWARFTLERWHAEFLVEGGGEGGLAAR